MGAEGAAGEDEFGVAACAGGGEAGAMNRELLVVLGLLGGCIVLFATNKVRMDVVALLALVVLPLTGTITVTQAFAGFGDPLIVLIAALFVVGEGLVRTGVAYRLSDLLARYARGSEARLIVLLMVTVALLGSVMSSTGVVAIFIPVALGIARRQRIPAARLMMPLSMAGLISGMLTLVGTAPNLVVDGTLKDAGHPGMGFFGITPVGAVVLVLGAGYMLLVRGRLSRPETPAGDGRRGRDFPVLIEEYRLAGRELRLRVRDGSPLAGQTLGELRLRAEQRWNVVAIEREVHFVNELIHPDMTTRLRAGDTLFIDRLAPKGDAATAAVAWPVLRETLGVDELALSGGYFSDHSRQVGMAEVAIPPESALAGRTVREAGFRRQHDLNVIGLRRDRAAVEGALHDEKIRVSDTLLVIGPWKAIRRMKAQHRDFIVLSLPEEAKEAIPAANRAVYALLSLATMIVLMVTGVVPNVCAALIACLMMGVFKCVDMTAAYRSIHWQSLILIAGMMPFATALERTGGVDLAVDSFMGLLSGAGPRLYLACLFVATAGVGLFISNTVTAVLMAPVALSMAAHLGVSPLPFAITVAVAASTAFVTPISSPVNTLVVEPGGYRFGDFVKIGLPFALVVLLVTVLILPVIYPF